MFKRKPKEITKFDVTNYLYPVGEPELNPILTWGDISESRTFRLNQQAEWDRDRAGRQTEVDNAKEMFAAYRRAAVDKPARV